jgi:hypothetical protein
VLRNPGETWDGRNAREGFEGRRWNLIQPVRGISEAFGKCAADRERVLRLGRFSRRRVCGSNLGSEIVPAQ